MAYLTKTVSTPIGTLRPVASEAGLAAILWANERPGRLRLGPMTECADHPVLVEAERQLVDYFAGRRQDFSVPLDLHGTEFQQRVWAVLRGIPFGETRSYGWIAARVGNAKASRAVGAANGRNPVSIMVPCHRAIGASGALTGFAGGLETKAFLLALEGRHVGKAVEEANVAPRRQAMR